jgi:hypothetical protein
VFHHLLNVHVQLANKKGLKKNETHKSDNVVEGRLKPVFLLSQKGSNKPSITNAVGSFVTVDG